MRRLILRSLSVTRQGKATRAAISAAALLAASALGCSGQVSSSADDPMQNVGGSGNSNAGTGGNGVVSGAGATQVSELPPGELPPEVTGEQFASPALRRLTVSQYQNTLRDLFGPDVDLPTDLEPDTALSGLTAIGASTLAVSARATELFEGAARDVTAQVFADSALRQALVGCTPSDASCVQSFVTNFGRRAWRRPLSTEEVNKFTSLAQSATSLTGDPWQGLSAMVSALLQSPNFLYRVEIGTADPAQPTRRILGSFEVASRLSYLLWGTTPDDTLLDAAQAGSLLDAGSIATQAQRLLDDPRAQTAVERFLSEYLGLDGLAQTEKLPEAFPAFTPSLREAMERETLLTLRTLGFDEGADFRTLLTSNTTFVNDELAQLYGIPAPGSTDLVRVTLPATSHRIGLLGQASLLSIHSHASSSSPTRRGKFVREILLCQSVPAPPPNVNTTLPDTAGAATMREKLALHAQDNSCAGCHKLMDPIGLALENFDGIGAYRETQNGVAIDASGELDGVPYADSAGLAQTLSQHARFPECVARTLYRYSFGHLETTSEAPAITALLGSFAASGYKLRDLMLATVQLPGFRYTGELD